jgi:hypothetical protein
MVDRPDYLQIAVWGGAAILGIALLVAVIVVYRRRYRADHDVPRSVWSLDDLNAMRRRGDLSESEYAHLRDRMLAQMGVQRPHRQRKEQTAPRNSFDEPQG